jgi:hypothetical protein
MSAPFPASYDQAFGSFGFFWVFGVLGVFGVFGVFPGKLRPSIWVFCTSSWAAHSIRIVNIMCSVYAIVVFVSVCISAAAAAAAADHDLEVKMRKVAGWLDQGYR